MIYEKVPLPCCARVPSGATASAGGAGGFDRRSASGG